MPKPPTTAPRPAPLRPDRRGPAQPGPSLVARVRPAIDQLVPADAPVVLMVSGGSDSTALLLLMARLVPTERLHVLHVNHLLRGASANADEVFVRTLAAREGIACTVKHVDVGRLAEEERGNVEAIGRRERYAAAAALLGELCEKAGVPSDQGRIATAHTRDDRVETFMMRASVGTGPGGLGSIRPQSGQVIHPLLALSRQELRGWLRDQGQDWCEDETNLVPDRDRTYMRLEVLPNLRSRNASFDANLERTMDLIADEDEYLTDQANGLYQRLLRPAPQDLVPRDEDGPVSAVALDAAGVAAAPLVLARRVVRQALLAVGGRHTRVEARRIDEVVNGASDPQFAADLPGFIRVRNSFQTLVFICDPDQLGWAASATAPWGGWLAIPGQLGLPDGWQLTASVEPVPARAQLRALDASREAFVDVGRARRLWVSGPREGERMVPLGFAHGSKKLSDVFGDRKVPAPLRGRVPVVRRGEGRDAPVVWLGGVMVDERSKIAASTAQAVHLTLHRAPER